MISWFTPTNLNFAITSICFAGPYSLFLIKYIKTYSCILCSYVIGNRHYMNCEIFPIRAELSLGTTD